MIPAASRRAPPVRALTSRCVAESPCSTTLLSPSITHPAPSRRAVVATSCTSYRACRSTCANASRAEPSTTCGISAAPPAARNNPPPSTIDAKYGSSTRPRPNASITIIVSTGPPPLPPCGFRERQPEQPKFGVHLPQPFGIPVRLARKRLAAGKVAVLVVDQPVYAVFEQPLFVRQVEVHCALTAPGSPWRRCCAGSRWCRRRSTPCAN